MENELSEYEIELISSLLCSILLKKILYDLKNLELVVGKRI